MKVLLFGATGTAGRGAALALRDAGHSVAALGRTDPGLPGIAFVPADIHAPDLAGHRAGAVVSCLASRSGAPADAWAIDHAAHLAILRAAEAAGIPRFVLVSAICVQKPRLAFQHAKLAFEAALRASPLDWTIVRPTALFKSLSGQLDRLRTGKPYLLFGDGRLTATKPISDRDLGRYIAACLADPATRGRILPIGGPGPALTPRRMGAALFDALGLPPRYRRVPPDLLRGIAGALRLAGQRDRAELARIGHYYATESMLVWDGARYDAQATHEFGSDTLEAHYRALAAGRVTLDRGAHAVF